MTTAAMVFQFGLSQQNRLLAAKMAALQVNFRGEALSLGQRRKDHAIGRGR